MKQYRVFFHFYRQYGCMSVHFRGKCHKVKDVVCNVPVETKWNNTQPNLVLQGFAKDVIIENEIAKII